MSDNTHCYSSLMESISTSDHSFYHPSTGLVYQLIKNDNRNARPIHKLIPSDTAGRISLGNIPLVSTQSAPHVRQVGMVMTASSKSWLGESNLSAVNNKP